MCYSSEIVANTISLGSHNAHHHGIYKFLVTPALCIPINTFGFKNLNQYTTVVPLKIETKKGSLHCTQKRKIRTAALSSRLPTNVLALSKYHSRSCTSFQLQVINVSSKWPIKNPKVPKRISY